MAFKLVKTRPVRRYQQPKKPRKPAVKATDYKGPKIKLPERK